MHIVGTDLALVIGHTVIALPYVVITLMVGLQTYDRQFDQAAATLGARPVRVLHRAFLIRWRAEHAA